MNMFMLFYMTYSESNVMLMIGQCGVKCLVIELRRKLIVETTDNQLHHIRQPPQNATPRLPFGVQPDKARARAGLGCFSKLRPPILNNAVPGSRWPKPQHSEAASKPGWWSQGYRYKEHAPARTWGSQRAR